MPQKPCRVWFLVVPRTSILDVAGPWEVLGHANEILGRAAYHLEIVGPHAPSMPTRHGLVLGSIRPLPKTTKRLPDVAIVAGYPVTAPSPEGEARLIPWLRRYRARLPRLVSICTGAFALGKAGALDGRRATTHWQFLGELQSRFPGARVVDEGVFVKDSGVYTSAGITAGIDLALSIVEEDHGHEVAMAVAKRLVLFLRRTGNQAQFSEPARQPEPEPPKLRGIANFVVEHIGEPLPVTRLARGLGMSVRTLTRVCRQDLDESPGALVRRLRVEEARRLLEETAFPLKQIAARTGLGDTSTLWRAFTDRLGVTPAEYRARFNAAADKPRTATG